jgi:hypothetical protein
MEWCPSLLLPPGPQSLRPGGDSWIGRQLGILRLSLFRDEFALVRRWVSFPQPRDKRQRWPSCELAPFLSVLSGRPPAQRS